MIIYRDITEANDIKDIYNILFVFHPETIRGRTKFSCDNIMTFDTEWSTGMRDPATGRAIQFDKKRFDEDYDKPETERAYQHYMESCDPVTCNYLWQFCCETFLPPPHIDESDLLVFIGRRWDEFKDFMDKLTAEIKRQSVFGFKAINRTSETKTALKDKHNVECFIFDHNLGAEMVGLCNIYNKEIAKGKRVFAREACNPMYIRLPLNKVSVNFKDTFVLTQLSLMKWTKNEKLQVQKLEEPEDFYDDIITPDTEIDSERLQHRVASDATQEGASPLR